MLISIQGGPLLGGEVRPLQGHSHAHFAVACCPKCGLQAMLSEPEFRIVARAPDAVLRCRRCRHVFHPIERLTAVLPPDLGKLPPRDGWL